MRCWPTGPHLFARVVLKAWWSSSDKQVGEAQVHGSPRVQLAWLSFQEALKPARTCCGCVPGRIAGTFAAADAVAVAHKTGPHCVVGKFGQVPGDTSGRIKKHPFG
eukprot:s3948_g4.t1